MFKAIHNVSIGFRLYKRGEEIPDIPKEMQERLLKLGAIRKMDAPFPVPETAKVDEDAISGGSDEATLGDGEEEEAAEDEEMAEIDVMDGIVSDEAPAAKGRSKGK